MKLFGFTPRELADVAMIGLFGGPVGVLFGIALLHVWRTM